MRASLSKKVQYDLLSSLSPWPGLWAPPRLQPCCRWWSESIGCAISHSRNFWGCIGGLLCTQRYFCPPAKLGKDKKSSKFHLFGEYSRCPFGSPFSFPVIVVIFYIAGDLGLYCRPETFHPCTVGGPWLKIGGLFAQMVILEWLLGPWKVRKSWKWKRFLLPGVWESSLAKFIVVSYKSCKLCIPQLNVKKK